MSETPARSCCVEETATEETISPSAFCSWVRESEERYLILLSLHESVEQAVEGAVAVDVADDEGVARLVNDAERGDRGEEAVGVGEDVQSAGVEHFDDRAGDADRLFRYVVDAERDDVIALMCEWRRKDDDSDHLLGRRQEGVERVETFVHSRIHEHDVAIGC